MKCKICGEKAAINLARHNLGLCKSHYVKWILQQTERTIKKYGMFTHADKVLIAVSGGKDSLALWDILHRLGYQVDGLYIDLGIDQSLGYSERSKQTIEEFSRERCLIFHQFDIKTELGKSLEEIVRLTEQGRQKPCSVCGLIKRYQMNRFAYEKGYTVLATGHNLDDEVAILFGNTMRWTVDMLDRQSPVLESSGTLTRKVKPLVRFYEREMAAYAILSGIRYIYLECPYSTGAPSLYNKKVLNQLEHDRPGTKMVFYLNFLKVQSKLFSGERVVTELNQCIRCGGSTSATGLCSYCRLMDRLNNGN